MTTLLLLLALAQLPDHDVAQEHSTDMQDVTYHCPEGSTGEEDCVAEIPGDLPGNPAFCCGDEEISCTTETWPDHGGPDCFEGVPIPKRGLLVTGDPRCDGPEDHGRKILTTEGVYECSTLEVEAWKSTPGIIWDLSQVGCVEWGLRWDGIVLWRKCVEEEEEDESEAEDA